MKILLITFEFPPQPGGIGTYSYEIAKHLASLGNDITVLAHTNQIAPEQIAQFDSQQVFRIIRYKTLNQKISKIFHRIAFTWKTVRKNNFDMFFISYAHAGILGWWFKKLYKIPYMMMGHGSEFLYKNLFLKSMIKLVFSNADLVLTNSRYTTRLVEQCKIHNKNIVTIPLGADDLLFDYKLYEPSEIIKEKYGYTHRKIILTVGSLSVRKGHRIVIEAIEKLRTEIPEVLYLIIGRGPEQENLQDLIFQQGLENHVKLLGFVPREQLSQYYLMCDVFILNSTIDSYGDTEGFGIVLMEANLMGKPVIGVKDSGMEDAIDHEKNGLLVARDNLEETTRALKGLLTNPLRAKQMGEYGYLRAKQEFTWRQVAIKTDETIKECLGAKIGENKER